MYFFRKLYAKLSYVVYGIFSMESSIKDKYDFQKDAVEQVVSEIINGNDVKKLIVIPTGGGKTWVGLQVINRLIKDRYISKTRKALWAVHSRYLKTQTNDFIFHEKNLHIREKLNFPIDYSDYLHVGMIGEVNTILSSASRNNYGLLIIDEAHHSAANSYKPFFQYHLPIIGLTATPTRLDGKELPFEGISFDITFSTLEKMGVITMPLMKNIPTNITVEADNINNIPNNRSFRFFNSPKRNKFIAEWIFSNRRNYHFNKIIVFTGSKNHARAIYDELKVLNEFNNSPFEHVGYIFGDGNEKSPDMTNNKYLEWQKTLDTGIIVNCAVLTEGYDDNKVDVVVMAVPTNSEVYYMQCMGRVVRIPEKEQSKKAYLFEFIDNLPNINYRINNRWLFGELNQSLEPITYDPESFETRGLLNNKILELLDEHNVNNEIPLDTFVGKSVSLLLFNDSSEPTESNWSALLLDDSEVSKKYVYAYNELSNTISNYSKYGDWSTEISSDFVIHDRLKIDRDDYYFSSKKMRETFVSALARAKMLKNSRLPNDCIKYYRFHYNDPPNLIIRIYKALNKYIMSKI